MNNSLSICLFLCVNTCLQAQACMYVLDTATNQSRVLDIVETELPDALTVIQTGSCSINGEFSIEIIATERKGKMLNGCRALGDKLRFQKIDRLSLQKTNCLVEGAD